MWGQLHWLVYCSKWVSKHLTIGLIIVVSHLGSDNLQHSPQARHNLSELAKCFALTLGKVLVSISAVISSVRQYTKLIVPFCTMNQMKWYWMSMCLVHVWYNQSFMSVIAECESKYRVIGFMMGWKILLIICQSQMASFAAYIAARYSDSAVDSVTNSCFFEDHEIAPPLTRKTYPEMAWWCSCEDPSTSIYPSNHCQ